MRRRRGVRWLDRTAVALDLTVPLKQGSARLPYPLVRMFLTALAVNLVCQIIETPRLRTKLSNGSVIFVEKMTGPALSVCLQASSKGAQDTASTHGFRHLLEHILAKGPDKELDRRLEAEGLYLTASTTRDAMRFQIDGPAEKLSSAINAIEELLKPLRTSPEEVSRECDIIERELSIRDPWQAVVENCWQKEFENTADAAYALSSDGSLESMRAASPEALESLRSRHFNPKNLVVTICGDIDVNKSTESVRKVLTTTRTTSARSLYLHREGVGNFHSLPSTQNFGAVARFVRIEGLGKPESLAFIAAAMMLTNEIDGAKLFYTPSLGPSVLTVIAPSESGFEEIIENRNSDFDQELRDKGQAFLTHWLAAQFRMTHSNALMRAILLSDGFDIKPEILLANSTAISTEEFRKALEAFGSGKPHIWAGRR